jgi:membrane protein implicated in regulation of membrane protease activity
MNIRKSFLSLAVAVGLTAAAGAAVAQDAQAGAATPPVSSQATDPMTEAQVRALLVGQGYTEINDVKFDEGTWTADAKSADGKDVEVRVDSATGKIIPDEPVATIGKDEIIVKLQEAGYTKVHDVEMEGGVWKAEANDSKGNDVEIKLDPNDGHILGSKKDVIGAKH